MAVVHVWTTEPELNKIQRNGWPQTFTNSGVNLLVESNSYFPTATLTVWHGLDWNEWSLDKEEANSLIYALEKYVEMFPSEE